MEEIKGRLYERDPFLLRPREPREPSDVSKVKGQTP